jgi:hypothetical protein
MSLFHHLAPPLRPSYKACLWDQIICGKSMKRHPRKWKRSLSSTSLVHDFLQTASGDYRSPTAVRHPNTNVKHLIAAI